MKNIEYESIWEHSKNFSPQIQVLRLNLSINFKHRLKNILVQVFLWRLGRPRPDFFEKHFSFLTSDSLLALSIVTNHWYFYALWVESMCTMLSNIQKTATVGRFPKKIIFKLVFFHVGKFPNRFQQKIEIRYLAFWFIMLL